MNHKLNIALLIAILAVVFLFGIITISTIDQSFTQLKNDISNNYSALISQISNVNTDIATVTYNIQTMLDKQESLIADYSITYGPVDAKTLTGDVTINVTPKTYSADITTDLYIDGEKTAMTRNGNSYTAKFSLPIDEYGQASVTFEQGGISTTEVLPEAVGFGGLVNTLSVEPMVDYSFENNTLSASGSLLLFFHSDFDSVATARFVAVENGKEIWTQDIPNPEQLEKEIPNTAEIPFSQTFTNISNDSDILIYVEVVGSSGLTYRKTILSAKETDISGVYGTNGAIIEFDNSIEP